ncbi:MAG: hypothetical protein NTY19_44360, partial [Planctomycetota bacterium]|nr:hypothetical protein [Planctomycetota bacterium]
MRRPASTQRKGIRQSPSRRVDLLSVRLAPRRHSRFRGLTYEVLEDRRLLAGTHNIVVAAAGDSYSSGEGNPAVSAWAEDNTNRGTATWLVGSTEEETAGNTLAHRSPFAASYVLYKDLEERLRQVDPQASVTFAFASAAGATIENSVMNPYAGVSYENVDPNYTPLPKQIQQIRQISTSPVVGKQPIDVLTLSFGGNDIGFGNIARSLLLIDDLLFPFSHDTLLKLLKKAVETGESEHWRALKASLLLPESLV